MQPTNNCLNTTHMSLLQINFTSIYASVSLMKLLTIHTSHLDRTITEAIEKETMKTMKKDYSKDYISKLKGQLKASSEQQSCA